jgi:serine/threonine-protein kinase
LTSRDPGEARIAALLDASYEMLGHLGRGGFATVYRVRNRRLGRVEALKVLSADSEEPDFAERFRQEARVAASLDHPGIVKIFDYGQAEDLCWFTMQFVDGPTLIRELKRKGPWSEAETASLSAAVADALDYSHRRGIIHRDIKPENILVDVERRPYLMDFGIAKSDQSVVHTRTGTILGSPAYIAPEQLTGTRVDGRADIYSLGATMYRMVSNSYPFQDSDPVRMAMKRFTMDPEPLGPKRPGIDATFEAIVMRALARDPAARFATAAEMSSALKRFLAGKPSRLSRSVPVASLPPEGAATPRGISQSASGPTVPPAEADTAPTIRTARSLPGQAGPSAGAPAEAAAPRSMRAWIAAAAVGGVLAAAAAMFLSRRAPARPASIRLPTPASQAPSIQPTARPALPLPAATVSDTPVPAAAAPAAAAPEPKAEAQVVRQPRSEPPAAIEPPPARAATRPPRVRPSEAAAGPPPGPAVPARRPAFPPESESEVPLELSPAIAREFANRSVGLSLLVGEDGQVKEARVISPLCPECDRAARAAILRYRFKPARDREGRPVESRVAVPVIIPAPENP